MTETPQKWTIYTSINLFEYCVYYWKNLMWMHLEGFKNEDMMRETFFYYLNYGNTHKDCEL